MYGFTPLGDGPLVYSRIVRSLRRSLLPALTALACVTALTTGAPEPAGAAALPTKTIVDHNARPLGPVTVIGDSVLLGSLYNSPTIVARLAEQGWGPIRAQAGGGYSTGAFGVELSYRSSYWIERWRSEGWDAPNVLVNLGANDSGFCSSNTTCAYEAIMHLVNTIGPGHRIWWPKITRLYTHQHQANAWNAALDRVAAERPDFFTWDWPTVMANGPFPSSDNTHLSPDGYRLRSRLMAETFTADLARARRVGGDAPLPAAIGVPSEYEPLAPQRIVDTREGPPGRLDAGDVLEVDLAPFVPDGTTAVAVNLTSAESDSGGYLTAYPCDRERRTVSNVNYAKGRSRGALAIVPVAVDGRLCVFSPTAGHVIVDLQGAFVPSGSRFTPLGQPDRLLDTRATGRAPLLEIPVPGDATAVAVNLTATGASSNGWLRAFACGEPPAVSNVNFGAGESVAGAAIVPVSPDGTICITSLVPVDVIVDITGAFSDDGAFRFQPADPLRMLDLRDATGGWTPLIGSRQTVDVRVAPPGAAAVTGTITLVRPVANGWARADACGEPPPTSNVNARAGEVMANSVTTAVTPEGRLCVTASVAAVALFDTTGWWVP